jgi:hypothetical protein
LVAVVVAAQIPL